MCGVVAVHAPGRQAARIAFFALHTQQHRGQEAAGIVSTGRGVAHLHRGMGLVGSVFDEDVLSALKGEIAIGHNRYSTTGESSLRNIQPHVIETIDGPLAVAHNGNLVNYAQLRRNLLENGVGLRTSSDTEVMLQLLVTAPGDLMSRIRFMMSKVQGSYALVILTGDSLYGVRDPWGFRPLVIGSLGNGHLLTSESCALSVTGASFVDEVNPGEIVRISGDGLLREQASKPKRPSFCTFEQIYFSRPDTYHNNSLVHVTRQRLGRKLAEEAPVEADLVLPVPDSGNPQAVGYAQESGLPYMEGLIKNRYVGRTFIQPTQELRTAGIAMKFNPLYDNLVGKKVVMVDDSIVRGNTAVSLIKMLRNAGVAEIHVRVACPPITAPCFMGVDIPDKKELIAFDRSISEVRDYIDADSLAYLSIEGMMEALESENGYCNACFTGVYPFQSDHFVQLRLGSGKQLASVWGE
ncbi:MAG: amidophosphoribosyltransferase [Acidimicrobiaceae bacterium]|nr:amidophosphoribosyltransferase [Acidimicrobiaceae bacterium]